MKYADFKKRKDFTSQYICSLFEEAGLDFVSQKLRDCGKFVHVAECKRCDARHFLGYKRCKIRFCANCAHVRSMLWLAKLYPFLVDWVLKGYVFFVTFTMRDEDRLEEMYNKMQEAWRYMVGKAKYMCRFFKRRYKGYIRSIEVKKGKNSRKWHVHYHCLFVSETYEKDFETLRDFWKHSCGMLGTEGSVYIRTVNVMNILSSVCEVVKYITKFEFDVMKKEDVAELYAVVHKRRMISTAGCFRKFDTEVEQEMDKWEERQLEKFVCRVCGCSEAKLRTVLYSVVRNDIIDL